MLVFLNVIIKHNQKEIANNEANIYRHKIKTFACVW